MRSFATYVSLRLHVVLADAEAFKACLLRLARDPECNFDEDALANWPGATAEVEPIGRT